MSGYENYLRTYAGKKLLEAYDLSEYGVWRIEGEDPNCDWGGHHSNPYINTVEGTLREVIENAVQHPKFWTWGAGGNILKVEILKPENMLSVDDIKKKALEKLNNQEKKVLGLI